MLVVETRHIALLDNMIQLFFLFNIIATGERNVRESRRSPVLQAATGQSAAKRVYIPGHTGLFLRLAGTRDRRFFHAMAL